MVLLTVTCCWKGPSKLVHLMMACPLFSTGLLVWPNPSCLLLKMAWSLMQKCSSTLSTIRICSVVSWILSLVFSDSTQGLKVAIPGQWHGLIGIVSATRFWQSPPKYFLWRKLWLELSEHTKFFFVGRRKLLHVGWVICQTCQADLQCPQCERRCGSKLLRHTKVGRTTFWALQFGFDENFLCTQWWVAHWGD